MAVPSPPFSLTRVAAMSALGGIQTRSSAMGSNHVRKGDPPERVSIRNIALSFVGWFGATSYVVARNLGSAAMRIARRLLSDKRGVGAIEYALVASLISIAALAGYQTLGNKMEKTYSSVDHAVQSEK